MSLNWAPNYVLVICVCGSCYLKYPALYKWDSWLYTGNNHHCSPCALRPAGGISKTTVQDGNKDTDLLENGLEDMGRGWGEM